VVLGVTAIAFLSEPSLRSAMSLWCPVEEQGALQGAMASLRTISLAVGSPAAGALFSWGIHNGPSDDPEHRYVFMAQGVRVVRGIIRCYTARYFFTTVHRSRLESFHSENPRLVHAYWAYWIYTGPLSTQATVDSADSHSTTKTATRSITAGTPFFVSALCFGLATCVAAYALVRYPSPEAPPKAPGADTAAVEMASSSKRGSGLWIVKPPTDAGANSAV